MRLELLSAVAALLVFSVVTTHHLHSSLIASTTPLELQVNTNGAGLNQVNSLAQSLGADSFGATIRNKLPRFGYVSNLGAVVKDNSQAVSYGIGIAIQFAYGLVLAILTVLVGCCFCWCRCCCNWCGGREPIDGGYTKCQRWGTFTIMLVFALVVAALAVFGWFNNNQVTSTAVGSTGIMSICANLISNIIYYLNGSLPQIGSSINSAPITTQLTTINTQVQSSISTVQSLLSQTGIIFTGVSSLISTINATGNSMSGTQIVINGTSFSCQFCQTVGGQVSAMSTQLQTQSAKPIGDMKNTINAANSSLVSISNSISTQVTSFKTAINGVVDSIVQYYTNLNGTWKTQATTYDNYRNIAVLVILILPCLSLLALLLGGIFKHGWPFTVYYWVGYVASFLIFLLFAVHLPIAVVFGDTCNYIAVVTANFSALPLGADATTFLNAAIYNTSLIDAFDSKYQLNAQLNFSNMIVFPSIPNISSQFEFSAISNFTSSVRALTLSTFGFNSNNVTNAINSLNSNFGTSYTRQTVSTCPGASNAAHYAEACALANGLTMQETGLNNTLRDMKNNATNLDAASANLQNAVTTVYNSTFSQLKNVVTPIINTVKAFQASAFCGFIGVSYFQLQSALCSTFLSAFTMIAFCAFAIGVLNFGVIVCSTVLAKRMPNSRGDLDLIESSSTRVDDISVQLGITSSRGVDGQSIVVEAPPPTMYRPQATAAPLPWRQNSTKHVSH